MEKFLKEQIWSFKSLIINDLSLLNSVTNGRATTTHFVFPEPISSGILTLLFTIF